MYPALRNQDNLSVRARLHYELVRAGSFFKRKFLADNRTQCSMFQSSPDSSMNFRQVRFGRSE